MKIFTLLILRACIGFALIAECAAQEVSTIRLDTSVHADGMIVDASGDVLITSAWDGSTIASVNVSNGATTTAVTGLSGPINVAVDEAGNIYNSNWTGNTISRTTPAGVTAKFANVEVGGDGLAFDSNGDLWWTNGVERLIRKISPTGVVSLVASGSPLTYPLGIVLAEDGNFYVSEGKTGVINRVTKNGTVSFFAQVPGTGKWKLGQITAGNGRLYAAGQDTNRVFEIDMQGNVSILAGSGQSISRDGTGVEAGFDYPLGATISHDHNTLYVISGAPAGTSALRVIQLNDGGQSDFLINAGLNDAWFDPTTNGQGFFITVYPDIEQMYLAWFTFDTERPPEGVDAMLGDSGHRWLTALGPYDGDTANLTIYVTEGGVFDSPEPETSTDLDGAGTMTIEFTDCTAGLVRYDIPSLGLSGEIPIQRVAEDNVPLCNALNEQPQ